MKPMVIDQFTVFFYKRLTQSHSTDIELNHFDNVSFISDIIFALLSYARLFPIWSLFCLNYIQLGVWLHEERHFTLLQHRHCFLYIKTILWPFQMNEGVMVCPFVFVIYLPSLDLTSLFLSRSPSLSLTFALSLSVHLLLYFTCSSVHCTAMHSCYIKYSNA